jgi:hypothetical protein
MELLYDFFLGEFSMTFIINGNILMLIYKLFNIECYVSNILNSIVYMK